MVKVPQVQKPLVPEDLKGELKSPEPVGGFWVGSFPCVGGSQRRIEGHTSSIMSIITPTPGSARISKEN